MDKSALLHRIMVLMSSRYPTEPVDTAYIFGRADRDYEPTEGDSGILETVADLFHAGLARAIVISNAPGGTTHDGRPAPHTYPGRKVFFEGLVALGIMPGAIYIPPCHAAHTRGDSDGFITMAKAQGWRTGVAVMPAYHALRAMLGLLKSFEVVGHKMRVVPIFPRATNWQKAVYGSQGELLLWRHEHIDQEWERIPRYQAEGDLATLEELEAYLLK